MNLELQTCSLEFSIHLKALGIKQESLFYWWQCEKKECANCQYKNPTLSSTRAEFLTSYSAFTVAELGEMLPNVVQSYRSFKEHWECVYDIAEIGCVEETEANARAKMLIYLLENKLINIKKD